MIFREWVRPILPSGPGSGRDPGLELRGAWQPWEEGGGDALRTDWREQEKQPGQAVLCVLREVS